MLSTCNVCNSTNLSRLWELPDFPLTGIYVCRHDDLQFQNEYPQELQYCLECSHAQLGNQIDPTFLYKETYSHRTSGSPISSAGNEYLLKYIKRKTSGRTFRQVLEIGCNDLYLLNNLKKMSLNQAGIDPIWPEGLGRSDDGINLWGGFAETTDYANLIDNKIDLVITAHTFEHITSPMKAIESLREHLDDDCIFVIEVPSAERMLEQGRLDQVFNQHVNYYSVQSIERLLSPLGFHLQDLDYNYSYWGGTQLLLFSSNSESAIKKEDKKTIGVEDYLSSITLFLGAMSNVSRQIVAAEGPVYMYGAAQMLPTLLYHFTESARKRICGVIDDNPARQGKYYPGLELRILALEEVRGIEDATIVVSALDSARSILPNLIRVNPRTIILPNGLM